MDEVELPSIAVEVARQIFNGAKQISIRDNVYPLTLTKSSRLRSIIIEGFLFIEQNPQKASQWAQKAKAGHQILWVIKGNKYLVRVMDGIATDLRKNNP